MNDTLLIVPSPRSRSRQAYRRWSHLSVYFSTPIGIRLGKDGFRRLIAFPQGDGTAGRSFHPRSMPAKRFAIAQALFGHRIAQHATLLLDHITKTRSGELFSSIGTTASLCSDSASNHAENRTIFQMFLRNAMNLKRMAFSLNSLNFHGFILHARNASQHILSLRLAFFTLNGIIKESPPMSTMPAAPFYYLPCPFERIGSRSMTNRR